MSSDVLFTSDALCEVPHAFQHLLTSTHPVCLVIRGGVRIRCHKTILDCKARARRRDK